MCICLSYTASYITTPSCLGVRGGALGSGCSVDPAESSKETEKTAYEATKAADLALWKRLESLFQDNKASRAAHLEEELTDLNFENFSSIDSYCNHIKTISERLDDVDATVPNSRLVLKLTGGLPEAYAGTVDFIQNQDPLPAFEKCRSRLKLAERTIKNRLAKEGGNRSQAALVSSEAPQVSHSAASSAALNPSRTKKSPNKSTALKRDNGKGRNIRPSFGPNWQQQPWMSWNPWIAQWPMPPPCPYPSSPWAPRPVATSSDPRSAGPGILGPRPQAYSVIAPSVSYTPTDIEAAMHALSFSQPDANYYLDTGATSHMTADPDGSQNSEE
ncbi:unnamed protein product [Cuscuta epithymum]|uniref:Uncharacterized protein n=1 Tax=Cuscuta epithymum TaxID=186058 RepID=A0AAV0CMD3_9ASTE|nr:unnamed protein product [Cuscuta epithymum]